MFDLVIKNGWVIDPSARISSRLNLGVKSGRIASLTRGEISGSTVIDAEGLIVAPGFIDMHIHEDPYDAGEDRFQYLIFNSMLKMGVTTVVGGNCGIGTTSNPVEYLDAVDRLGCPVNVGMLSPHERLRTAFGSFSRYESLGKETIAKMEELLQSQLDGGCLGVSLGMEYIPGIDKAEATAMIRVAEQNGKLVTVHQRDDGDKAVSSVEELAEYAAETGVRLQISHLSSMCSFGGMEEALSVIDDCRAKGMDILFDAYPYYAFCTTIGSAVFDEGFLAHYGYGDEGYSKLQVDESYLKGGTLTPELFKKIREREPEALVVAHVLNEAEVDRCITHPAGIVVSDGLYKDGTGHPRGSGTFPKLIREYVTERKLLTLEATIEKITWLPARRMNLTGKGSLTIGADADITIFDRQRIRDGATYQQPLKEPEGIEYVVLGGEIALKAGEIRNGRLGKAIRG